MDEDEKYNRKYDRHDQEIQQLREHEKELLAAAEHEEVWLLMKHVGSYDSYSEKPIFAGGEEEVKALRDNLEKRRSEWISDPSFSDRTPSYSAEPVRSNINSNHQ